MTRRLKRLEVKRDWCRVHSVACGVTECLLLGPFLKCFAFVFVSRPDLVEWRSLKSTNIRERLDAAFHVVEREYGVTRLLDPEGKAPASSRDEAPFVFSRVYRVTSTVRARSLSRQMTKWQNELRSPLYCLPCSRFIFLLRRHR